MRRVVVTGLGCVSPLGLDVESTFKALCDGRSAAGLITRFDTSNFPVKIAAEIKGFDPSFYLDKKEIRRNDLYTHYAIASTEMAKRDANFDDPFYPKDRIGIIWGSGIGGITTFEEQMRIFLTQGPSKVSPFFITMMISNMAAGILAIRYGYTGDNYGVVSACASGAHAIGIAYESIKN
ncbi:MAG: beta-ketoacyl synthase N-terminal-like domain-containing protein, partial [bacterium]